jgi:hypothetical protein
MGFKDRERERERIYGKENGKLGPVDRHYAHNYFF